MAIGAGYFIASSVTKHLLEIKTNDIAISAQVAEVKANQIKYWEIVRRGQTMTLEVLIRTCVHQASDAKERDDCMKGLGSLGGVEVPRP